MQDWPPTRRYLMATAPSTAATRSASSKTMNGALPPSSKLRRLICGAAPAMIARPVAVEPVNAIFRLRGWLSSSSWSVRAGLAVTTLNVPGGSPASSAMLAMASAVSGVAGEGFSTTVQPAARAAASFRVTIVAGKFQGVTAATGPTGWRSTHVRFPVCGDGTHSPVTRRACSANQPKYPRANWTSLRASSKGLPFSVVMRRARSSPRSSIKAWIASSIWARSRAGRTDHSRKAPCAASAARCASLGPASLTVATTDPSAGLTTSKVAPPRAWTHLPSMYMRAISDLMTPPWEISPLVFCAGVAEAVRGLDASRGPGNVLALELLEVADTRHDVVALGGMAGLRPLERPLRLLLVLHQLFHGVPHRVHAGVGRVEGDEDELVAQVAQLLEQERVGVGAPLERRGVVERERHVRMRLAQSPGEGDGRLAARIREL